MSVAISNPQSFWLEARLQVVCAVCKTGGRYHSHHVIAKNFLRRNRLPLWDTRNALRLCERCHMQFEWAGPGKVEILARHLTAENMCYIWAVMGAYGSDFLNREYGGSDPRFALHLENGCRCQFRS